MSPSKLSIKESETPRKRLQWLMFFRVVIATFFLGIAAITHLQKEPAYLAPYLVYIYGLIGGIYVLTFIYLTLLFIIKDLLKFIYSQILIDILFITVLVFITGGRSSIYPFMYSISIISASIFLYLPGGLTAATVSSLLYALIISLQHYGIILPFDIESLNVLDHSNVPFYYPVIVNISSFYLVALLSSFLAEQTKKSQLQLREKQVDIENLEVLNENIIQSINSGLLTLDLEDRVVTFNQSACEITGLSHSVVFHKCVKDIFSEIVLPEYKDMPDGDFAVPRFEILYKKNDGKVLYLGFSISILRDKAGRRIGRILGFQDLTNFREMEEQVKRMDRLAAVGRLAAGIAHEVRNPLASISGSVQVLSKNPEIKEDDKRLMDIIVRESNNLNLLISDFTQFARPVKQDRERINLKRIIEEVVHIFKNSRECVNLSEVKVNINETLHINVGHQQFNQVLWNLLNNAVQSMSDGKGEISVDAGVMEEGFMPVEGIDNPKGTFASSWIELKVSDTGCGIDNSKIDRIFDPFFTTKDRGTGLGLSIVHKIVGDYDGYISVESEEGKGTVFSIYLYSY